MVTIFGKICALHHPRPRHQAQRHEALVPGIPWVPIPGDHRQRQASAEVPSAHVLGEGVRLPGRKKEHGWERDGNFGKTKRKLLMS